jgi:hypothetical protein
MTRRNTRAASSIGPDQKQLRRAPIPARAA